MKKILSIVSILFAFVSATQAQPLNINNPTSLFDRLGRTEGITSIVDDVVVAHMNNPAIKDKFVYLKDQPERLAVIKQHTIEFFTAGSGGPQVYNGKDMPTTHKGMNISPTDYMYVVDDIMMALDKHKIDEESKKDVLAILWSLKGMIINK
ncbi:MAG TPA: group 1 truncated hemoglobin [Paludibacter sp.]|nr:group 1 truncated hemoglobin [Paludibacter sp.]